MATPPLNVQKLRYQNLTNTIWFAKRGALTMVSYNIVNPNSVDVFVKLYDSNNDPAPVVGTTEPFETIQVAANGSVVLYDTLVGLYDFENGICAAVTTGIADSNTTVPSLFVLFQIGVKES